MNNNITSASGTSPRRKLLTTRTLVTCAMLAACAFALKFFEIPLPFIAPPFYKLDFSDVPVLIGGFSIGPVAGVVIVFIKEILTFITKSSSGGIGELANFVVGSAFVLTASFIYKAGKSRKTAVVGMLSATALMTVAATLMNAFVLVPVYARLFFNNSVESIIAMGSTVFPAVDSLLTFCLLCVIPFNIIKGLAVSVVTFLLYKPLSKLIHGRI